MVTLELENRNDAKDFYEQNYKIAPQTVPDFTK